MVRYLDKYTAKPTPVGGTDEEAITDQSDFDLGDEKPEEKRTQLRWNKHDPERKLLHEFDQEHCKEDQEELQRMQKRVDDGILRRFKVKKE